MEVCVHANATQTQFLQKIWSEMFFFLYEIYQKYYLGEENKGRKEKKRQLL